MRRIAGWCGCCLLWAAMVMGPPLGCAGGRGAGVKEGMSIEQIVGYREVERDGVMYVVDSLASAEKVRAGKPLPGAINAFGAGGQPVVFEADGAGLEDRLMAEYRKRHGPGK